MGNLYARRCAMCGEWYDERAAESIRIHSHPEPQSGAFRDLHIQSHLPYERWIGTLVGKAYLESQASKKEAVRCAAHNATVTERERCRREEVEPLKDAAEYAKDCLDPETDPRSSGMALHKLRVALAAVETAQKEQRV